MKDEGEHDMDAGRCSSGVDSVSVRQAFERVREHASVAAEIETELLRLAVARASEVAYRAHGATGVLACAVDRSSRESQRSANAVPSWGSEAAWAAAQREAGADDVSGVNHGFVPFEWVEIDQGRVVTRRPFQATSSRRDDA